jgi:hypothetical protein
LRPSADRLATLACLSAEALSFELWAFEAEWTTEGGRPLLSTIVIKVAPRTLFAFMRRGLAVFSSTRSSHASRVQRPLLLVDLACLAQAIQEDSGSRYLTPSNSHSFRCRQ